MATYAIGDIQGCYAEFDALLAQIKFDPQQDTLWLCGDLVNRGPDSLRVLRFIKSIANCVVCVLGNHDLHLLAIHAGVTHTSPSDTLDDVLAAPDCDELCEWLRQQKLLHIDLQLNYALVHAGLAPQWTLTHAQQYAHNVETCLRRSRYHEFLSHMYGDQPTQWSDSLTGWPRLRFICNALTRMRYCTPDGKLDFTHKGPLGSQPSSLIPWFSVPQRAHAQSRILFGHWASLLGQTNDSNAICLDTGCVWGHYLTALRLEDGHYFQQAAIR